MNEAVDPWQTKARAKTLPEEFIKRLDESETVTEEEKEKIVDALRRASDVPQPDPPPRPEPSEDAPIVPDEGKPDTKSTKELTLLKPDELPLIGTHFVIWGSTYLNDIMERPVMKAATKETENEYASRLRHEAQMLVAQGIKNPKEWTDPGTRRPADRTDPRAVKWDRMDRAEAYARWRYKGYVCGEVVSL